MAMLMSYTVEHQFDLVVEEEYEYFEQFLVEKLYFSLISMEQIICVHPYICQSIHLFQQQKYWILFLDSYHLLLMH